MSGAALQKLADANGEIFNKARELQTALDESDWVPSQSEEACIQLIIESINISLAAKDLLESAYSFPAEILLRALEDRVSTVQYIALEGEKGLYQWQANKLPSLAERVSRVFDFSDTEMDSVLRPHIKLLHKANHGDSSRKAVNQGIEEGIPKYWLGPNPTRPDQSENISLLFESWHHIILHFTENLIGFANKSQADKSQAK